MLRGEVAGIHETEAPFNDDDDGDNCTSHHLHQSSLHHDHDFYHDHGHDCHRCQDIMHPKKQLRGGVGHSMEEARQTKSTLAFS